MKLQTKDDLLVREALRMLQRHLLVSEPTEENKEKYKRVQAMLEFEDIFEPVDFCIELTFKDWYEENKGLIRDSRTRRILNAAYRSNHELMSKKLSKLRLEELERFRNFGRMSREYMSELFKETGYDIP